MNNGFYERKEMKVTIYERENCPGDVFAVIVNDTYPDKPVVLTGKLAKNLVNTMVYCINDSKKN